MSQLEAKAHSPIQNTTPDSSQNTLTSRPATCGKMKRKKKRLLWTEEMHLRFVSAVFELGVTNASPKALLAIMEAKDTTEELTSEHIKSHLQKYRMNYERSRLEVQKLNDKHAKRLKRHRRKQRRAKSTSAPTESALPQASTEQLTTCNADLLEGEGIQQHMHWTMQQRMDFHRELLLTRSVEVASGLSWANRMSNLSSRVVNNNANNGYERQEAENASFLQAWANAEQLRQQQEQVYGRLHQQQQNLFPQQQDTVPPVVDSRVQDESMNADGSVDLSSWSRLSLTVDPDNEDLFSFLNPVA